ncbi:MAG: tRNA pseudouridine(55) synthase TruB [Clostridia bacterium]|nr:tRNA pseudouridine(55) synthase TruB [Clostridia bacterium]
MALYKPAGFTSHDAAAKARGIFKTKKIGHTGTLDPMATGVLVLLIGSAAKALSLLPDETKSYRARFVLGISTDTQDVTGTVLRTDQARPSLDDLRSAAENFVGGYMQLPPMYSAVKINGKKLYEYARKGIEVERTARFVGISEFEVSPTDDPEVFEAFVTCSKGTYIRTLLCDLAGHAGALCAMSALERTACCGFTLDDCVSFGELENSGDPEKFLSLTERLFSSLPRVDLGDFHKKLSVNGQPVYEDRSGLVFPETGRRVSMYSGEKFFAVGEVVMTDEGKALKTLRQFD